MQDRLTILDRHIKASSKCSCITKHGLVLETFELATLQSLYIRQS